ncbi:MAG: hypothetical protein KIH44_007275 [Octadecabacter sp.]|nr:hypothetical protein [Octadecabacter sp.]
MAEALTRREYKNYTPLEPTGPQLPCKVPLPRFAEGLMLVGFENPFQAPIRRAAQALGIPVLLGTNTGPTDNPELIVASIDSYKTPQAIRERQRAQQKFPNSAVCVLLNDQKPSADQQFDEHDFNDAYALMEAAGFQFLSFVEGEAQ